MDQRVSAITQLPIVRSANILASLRGSNALWVEMRPTDGPWLTEDIVRDMRRVIRNTADTVRESGLDHVVFSSAHPDCFSAGLDLEYLADCIQAHEYDRVVSYREAFQELLLGVWDGFGEDVLTYALVENDAIGAGTELILACDFRIVESSARVGFIDEKYGMPPTAWAETLLSRHARAQRSVGAAVSGTDLMTTGQLREITVLADKDVVPDGQGKNHMRDLIRLHGEQLNSLRGMKQTRRIVAPLPIENLRDSATVWADSALELTPKQIASMRTSAQAIDPTPRAKRKP